MRSTLFRVLLVSLLVICISAPLVAQRPNGMRNAAKPASQDTFTPVQNVFYIATPVASIAEVCAQLGPDGVVVKGDGAYPFIVVNRLVGDFVWLPGPFVVHVFASHTDAGSYVDTWRFYKSVRMVTASDGVPLVVERYEAPRP